MNSKALTDSELHFTNVDLAEKQRRITLEQLNHLNETEIRRLFSNFSCDSLHAYCTKELKLDEGTAGRYISAARLLRDVPEVQERIVQGTTCVTSIAQVGVFVRREEKAGQTFDIEIKRTLLNEIDQKSTCEVERILVPKSPNPDIHLRERITPKTEEITELKIHIDQETMKSLERLKEIWSHAMPHANFADLIKRALKESLEKNDPLEKAARSRARAQRNEKQSTPAPESKLKVQRDVWIRDKGECSFVDPRTGEICAAKHFLEEDHIVPKAMGGAYTTENMRLRCRAHNQRHAINTFGIGKMAEYLN